MAQSKPYSRLNVSDRLFDIGNVLFMIVVLIVTLYPFLHVLALSFNDSVDTVRGGITIFPREFTLENYKVILTKDSLLTAFVVSVSRTVVGTILGLIACSMVAYTLSRRDFQARKLVSVILLLTLYVSGGLIPVFLLFRDLGLLNTFWVYVLPGMVGAFYVFVIRSFMDNLPHELQESAKLDGANDFGIYARIILPLCKPVLATIALFLAVGQWNSWFDTYLYNGSSPHLTTLQFELVKILQSTQTSIEQARFNNVAQQAQFVSPDSIKMAITIVTIVPILLVYPFLQRYFVKGLTLGAVKS
ncbi:carbohydrate ABC transporter permease [Xylanibacillus composti]|uniref:Sugar ABC transporter permease n=1 Tax=Xylanibacillus composti TaxID=1572762 RepID=A0A8J4M3A2_9BACL|nr:carbohydrate ABC transporter permease [Xylanibacillus composti]MDT9726156.1 carbohydrate ABC transporter permease [Xylanibacillus composti]GIQ70609.1 sugar ABC transporter permease [Xylanibacillus composti]